MSDRAPWMNDINSLRQMRDELLLKAHLLRAELRDQLDRLEHDFKTLERDLRPVGGAVGTTVKELDTSTRNLLKTLRAGYERIREAIQATV